MRLSISNIAWRGNNDLFMYEILRSYGYQGLEIAPTRIFMEHPYSHRAEAKHWATELKMNMDLKYLPYNLFGMVAKRKYLKQKMKEKY